ncbi:hypothetical protein SDC9_102864 [bioreactor metagenome]|uniref:Uncharacterized protein n=1 Tax=bioreactor metagenome TaxID=1076179 RepID=A0A645AS08_9ZZZZ
MQLAAGAAGHLGQHDDHRQVEVGQSADELRLERLEPPVHAAHAVPDHVDLVLDRPAAHLPDVGLELLDQLPVVATDLQAAGVQ